MLLLFPSLLFLWSISSILSLIALPWSFVSLFTSSLSSLSPLSSLLFTLSLSCCCWFSPWFKTYLFRNWITRNLTQILFSLSLLSPLRHNISHLSHYFQDSKLLKCVKLSERIKLWNRYTGPINQHFCSLSLYLSLSSISLNCFSFFPFLPLSPHSPPCLSFPSHSPLLLFPPSYSSFPGF